MTMSQYDLNLLPGGSSLWFFHKLRAISASTSWSSWSICMLPRVLFRLMLLTRSESRDIVLGGPRSVRGGAPPARGPGAAAAVCCPFANSPSRGSFARGGFAAAVCHVDGADGPFSFLIRQV